MTLPDHHLCLLILLQLFQERAIWTRQALFNQFTPMEARDIHKCVVSDVLAYYE